jgi:hypothetical protein
MKMTQARLYALENDFCFLPVLDWLEFNELDELDVLDEIKAKGRINGESIGYISDTPAMSCHEAITNVIVMRRMRAEEAQAERDKHEAELRAQAAEKQRQAEEQAQWEKNRREREAKAALVERERLAQEAQEAHQRRINQQAARERKDREMRARRDREDREMRERVARAEQEYLGRQRAASILRNNPTLCGRSIVDRMYYLLRQPGNAWSVSNLAHALHCNEQSVLEALDMLVAQQRLRQVESHERGVRQWETI